MAGKEEQEGENKSYDGQSQRQQGREPQQHDGRRRPGSKVVCMYPLGYVFRRLGRELMKYENRR